MRAKWTALRKYFFPVFFFYICVTITQYPNAVGTKFKIAKFTEFSQISYNVFFYWKWANMGNILKKVMLFFQKSYLKKIYIMKTLHFIKVLVKYYLIAHFISL